MDEPIEPFSVTMRTGLRSDHTIITEELLSEMAEHAEKNPPLLWSHNSQTPIGKAVGVRVVDGCLVFLFESYREEEE